MSNPKIRIKNQYRIGINCNENKCYLETYYGVPHKRNDDNFTGSIEPFDINISREDLVNFMYLFQISSSSTITFRTYKEEYIEVVRTELILNGKQILFVDQHMGWSRDYK